MFSSSWFGDEEPPSCLVLAVDYFFINSSLKSLVSVSSLLFRPSFPFLSNWIVGFVIFLCYWSWNLTELQSSENSCVLPETCASVIQYFCWLANRPLDWLALLSKYFHWLSSVYTGIGATLFATEFLYLLSSLTTQQRKNESWMVKFSSCCIILSSLVESMIAPFLVSWQAFEEIDLICPYWRSTELRD